MGTCFICIAQIVTSPTLRPTETPGLVKGTETRDLKQKEKEIARPGLCINNHRSVSSKCSLLSKMVLSRPGLRGAAGHLKDLGSGQQFSRPLGKSNLDLPWGSAIYTIEILESRIGGGSTFWILLESGFNCCIEILEILLSCCLSGKPPKDVVPI